MDYNNQDPQQFDPNAAPPAPQAPPPPYNPGGYAPQPQPYNPYYQAPPSDGRTTAALVLGIVSLACCVLCWISALSFLIFLGLPISIVGLVLSVGARKADHSGKATAALVLNIIGLVLSAIFFAIILCACIAAASILGGLGVYY